MTTLFAFPCRERAFGSPGDDLLVCDIFHANVRMVMLRVKGQYSYAGWVEGDGATHLRQEKASRVRILDVSEISGCAKLCISAYHTEVTAKEDPA